jgi:SagB-type dehydrogenase family enzyme
VDPLLTPCLDCLDRPAGAADGDDASTAPDPDADSVTSAEAEADRMLLAAGLAATDLVGLLSRATRVGLPVRWRRIRLDRLVQSARTGATRPGCPRCSAAPSPAPRPAPPSARYEAAVALPPKRYADAKAHQVHYQPANVALQRGHKTWPLAPRRPLPVPDLARLADPAAAPTGVDTDTGVDTTIGVDATTGVDTATGVDTGTGEGMLADLALLLAIGAGWQREQAERVWRWTASGGNIGSVVAHLLVRDVPGLAPGGYGYLPATHELALLRPAGYGWPGGCPCGAPACLVLTADLARVAQKYGAFGLRVVLLDAGCAHTALLEVAGRLRLGAVADPGFDDARLSALLGTDPEAEPITGLIHLDRPAPPGGAR